MAAGEGKPWRDWSSWQPLGCRQKYQAMSPGRICREERAKSAKMHLPPGAKDVAHWLPRAWLQRARDRPAPQCKVLAEFYVLEVILYFNYSHPILHTLFHAATPQAPCSAPVWVGQDGGRAAPCGHGQPNAIMSDPGQIHALIQPRSSVMNPPREYARLHLRPARILFSRASSA